MKRKMASTKCMCRQRYSRGQISCEASLLIREKVRTLWGCPTLLTHPDVKSVAGSHRRGMDGAVSFLHLGPRSRSCQVASASWSRRAGLMFADTQLYVLIVVRFICVYALRRAVWYFIPARLVLVHCYSWQLILVMKRAWRKGWWSKGRHWVQSYVGDGCGRVWASFRIGQGGGWQGGWCSGGQAPSLAASLHLVPRGKNTATRNQRKRTITPARWIHDEKPAKETPAHKKLSLQRPK